MPSRQLRNINLIKQNFDEHYPSLEYIESVTLPNDLTPDGSRTKSTDRISLNDAYHIYKKKKKNFAKEKSPFPETAFDTNSNIH